MLSLEVRVSDGMLSSSTRVLVRVEDVNDHTPTFLDSFLSLRVPVSSRSDADSGSGEISLPVQVGFRS